MACRANYIGTMYVETRGNVVACAASVSPSLLFSTDGNLLHLPRSTCLATDRIAFPAAFLRYTTLTDTVRFGWCSVWIRYPSAKVFSVTSELEDSISGQTSAGADGHRGLCLTQPTPTKSSTLHLSKHVLSAH